MQTLIRLALPHEAEKIVNLVNFSYRKKHPLSWTNESSLIDGERVNLASINDHFAVDSYLFVVIDNDEIQGCIHLNVQSDTGCVGMLTVHPEYQNRGLAKSLLDFVEQLSTKELHLKVLELVVIVERKELMAFYQRRGYVPLDNLSPYPAIGFGSPLVAGLHIQKLQKVLSFNK